MSIDIGGWLIWGGVGLQVSGLAMTRFDLVRAGAPQLDLSEGDALFGPVPVERNRGVLSEPADASRLVAASDRGTVLAHPRPEADRDATAGTAARPHHDPRVRRVWRGLAMVAFGVVLTARGVMISSPAPDEGGTGSPTVDAVALGVDGARD